MEQAASGRYKVITDYRERTAKSEGKQERNTQQNGESEAVDHEAGRGGTPGG